MMAAPSATLLLDPSWIEQAQAKYLERTKFARGKFERPNPCVVKYGPSSTGGRCRDCKHLLTIKPGRRAFYKCPLRGPITNGPATDHLKLWPACAHLAPRQGDAGSAPSITGTTARKPAHGARRRAA